MKTWNERLSEELSKSPYNQRSFAKAVGVSAPTVTDWLNGKIKELKGPNLERVCALLRLNAKWLLTGRGQKSANESLGIEEPSPEYLAVPFMDVSLRASRDGATGYEVHFENDDTIQPLYYRRDWLKKNGYRIESLVAHKVSGSSMEAALFDGDKVLINKGSRAPKNGRVFMVIVDGHPMIKRIRKRGSEWWITSDNQAHSNTDLPLENEQQIIGEAVEKSSTNI